MKPHSNRDAVVTATAKISHCKDSENISPFFQTMQKGSLLFSVGHRKCRTRPRACGHTLELRCLRAAQCWRHTVWQGVCITMAPSQLFLSASLPPSSPWPPSVSRVDHIALLLSPALEPHCATQEAYGFPDFQKKVQKERGDAQMEDCW